MSTANPLLTEWNRGGGPRLATLAGLAETWICPTVDGVVPVTDLVAGNLLSFVYQKKVWLLDPTDTTSANDGVTVIVTSDSKRFKSTAVYGQGVYIWPVIDFQNTPPTTPAAGDTYGVGAAPTGAWSSQAKAIATCLVGGGSPVWTFTPAVPGMAAYDKSQNIYRSVTSSVAWVDGLAGVYGTATIPAEALIAPRFTVQSQTATPPVSPSLNQYWIVGASATGAWSGHDGAIAKCTNATGPVWAFFTASEGFKAWNVATIHEMVYSGGVWADAQRPRIIQMPVKLIGTSTVAAAGTAVAFGTPPTSATGALLFPQGTALIPAYTLAKATNRLKIQLRLDSPATATVTDTTDGWTINILSPVTIAVYKDAQVTADAGNYSNLSIACAQSSFLEFEIAIGDTSSHQYNIRAYGGNGFVRQELQFVEIET